jgi:hypothetical protein
MRRRGRIAASQLRAGDQFERLHLHRGQPLAPAPHPGTVESGQELALGDRRSCSGQLDGVVRAVGGQCVGSRAHVRLRALDVDDGAGRQADGERARRGADRVRRRSGGQQRRADLRHDAPQGDGPRRRQPLRPQDLRDRVAEHRRVALQHERGERCPRLRGTQQPHVDRPVVATHLDRAREDDLHPAAPRRLTANVLAPTGLLKSPRDPRSPATLRGLEIPTPGGPEPRTASRDHRR